MRIQDKTKLAFEAVPSHRKYRLRLARYAGMAEAIASYLEEEQRETALKMLEIGPGRGRSVRFCQVAGIADRLEFWGIDKSKHRCQSIYEPSRWELTLGDAQEGLPYSSSLFDICVCEQVLEHLESPEKVIEEMVRVLRPGGLMIVGVPIFPPGIAQFRAFAVDKLYSWFNITREHIQTFTNWSIVAMLCSDHPLQLRECRGFRMVSGGVFSWLEDYKYWYRLNRRIGEALPWLCTEVQIVLRKENVR